MKSRKQIMETYRQGDLQKRLHLFLDCPELRREMIEIEQNETAATGCAAQDPVLSYRGKKSILSRIGCLWPLENCCRSNR